jgi:hypothetical protein
MSLSMPVHMITTEHQLQRYGPQKGNMFTELERIESSPESAQLDVPALLLPFL